MRTETANRSWWIKVSRSIQSFPADLMGILVLLILTNVILRVPGLRDVTLLGARVQMLVAIPMLLFAPGNVLVAILFPGRADRDIITRRIRDIRSIDSIDLVERVALSFGMSVALIPLYGLIVGTVWGFSLPAVLNSLTGIVLVGIGLALIQRLRCPRDDRYQIPVGRWATDLHRGIFHPNNITDGVANIILVIAVLTAVGAIGYAVATPYQSGQSSTLYLVTENETGSQVASGYPTNFIAGEGQSLTVGIRNDEEHRQQYTIVIRLERVEVRTTETTVTESLEVDRVHPVVPDGRTWTGRHTVVPELVGEDLRLHYYLYKGTTAPSNPDASSAYRDVYIWIDVAES